MTTAARTTPVDETPAVPTDGTSAGVSPVVDDLDARGVAVARALAMDAVEAAGSGHPGTAMALAPVAHALFQRHLRHDPNDPAWPGRDRFVLSCGHASILLYTQLVLTGYDLPLDELTRFRRLGSRTPGHPELGHTPGVEMTTGPLAQGVATAVGMALALRRERDLFDPDAPAGTSPFDRTVWVLASDGDLQEGLSYEAAAIAGHHRLDNLVVVFDDNRIQIDGSTGLASSEDVVGRFEAQGWDVQVVALAPSGDVDVAALDRALDRAHHRTRCPQLVVLRSQIAFPAPHAVNTAASHGAPLGADEVAATRPLLGAGDPFTIPADVLAHTRDAARRGAELHHAWDERLAAWRALDEERATEWDRIRSAALPDGFAAHLPRYAPGSTVAPRDASGATLQALAPHVPELWGGSADLGESTRTALDATPFLPFAPGSPTGRTVHFGVREHAMASIMNGIALAGGGRFFAGTFLVFSDYQRPAVRLAALMGLPVTYVWTHDSVALGADGPTHQPIEHLASLRAMPGLAVVRPADGNETVAAWAACLERARPTGLVLARQAVPILDVDVDAVHEGVRRGGYVVADDGAAPDAILVATGSEVSLALAARDELRSEGLRLRVVSMPCREWFAEQPAAYRDAVLPPDVTARVVVEAATPFGWADVAGPGGRIVGIDGFGVSAPAQDALDATGMTVAAVVAAVREVRR